jgi:hypothetical protein
MISNTQEGGIEHDQISQAYIPSHNLPTKDSIIIEGLDFIKPF